jgi:phosphoribosyl-ATP pyrophosphohydrolase
MSINKEVFETMLNRHFPERARELEQEMAKRKEQAAKDDPLTSVCRTALWRFGVARQKVKAMEECAELIVQLAKGSDSAATIVDEIADVTIMMRQLTIVYGEKAIQERIDFKVDRLRKLLGAA